MYGTYGGPLPATYGDPLPARYGGERDTTAVAGVARASTYGNPLPATYGNPLPATYGSPTHETEPARVDGAYAITLFNRDGERLVIDNVIGMDASRSRSAVNTLVMTVPWSGDELAEWRFSEVILTYDRQTNFRGELREVDPDPTSSTTTLTVYGPSYALQAGDLEITVTDERAVNAIEWFWDEYTDFTVTITRRQNSRDEAVIDEQEFSGTPLEILNELHEAAGYHWYVDVRKEQRAYSFPRSRAIRSPDFETIGSGYQPMWDTTDYFNRVIAYGETEGGDLIQAEARAEDEIEEKGEMTWPEYTDHDSEGDLRAYAETQLEEFLTNDERSGSIEMVPRSIDPGTALVIDEWDDERRVGPYSLHFDGENDVVIISHEEVLEGRQSGALMMWVRAPFDDVTHNPHVFSARWGSEDGDFRISDTFNLTFRIGGDTGVVSVDAYPDSDVPADEWTFIHFDWEYDADDNRTIVRAGNNGQIMSEGGFTGKFEHPPHGLTFGRYGTDYYEGYLDDVRLYSKPQPEEYYADLANRREIPASDIVSRWPLNDGPQSGVWVNEIIQGYRGHRDNPEYRGNPLPVESVNYSESAGEFSMTVDFGETDSWAKEMARTRSDIRSRSKR